MRVLCDAQTCIYVHGASMHYDLPQSMATRNKDSSKCILPKLDIDAMRPRKFKHGKWKAEKVKINTGWIPSVI